MKGERERGEGGREGGMEEKKYGGREREREREREQHARKELK